MQREKGRAGTQAETPKMRREEGREADSQAAVTGPLSPLGAPAPRRVHPSNQQLIVLELLPSHPEPHQFQKDPERQEAHWCCQGGSRDGGRPSGQRGPSAGHDFLAELDRGDGCRMI